MAQHEFAVAAGADGQRVEAEFCFGLPREFPKRLPDIRPSDPAFYFRHLIPPRFFCAKGFYPEENGQYLNVPFCGLLGVSHQSVVLKKKLRDQFLYFRVLLLIVIL